MKNAINGEPNPAFPIALAGMAVLAVALYIFWFLFPLYTSFSFITKIIIQVSGSLSMIAGFFIFTQKHDFFINIAGLFGMIAITGTFIGLYKLKWTKLFWMGISNLLMIGINNYCYYFSIIYLPVIQKLTFAFFLIWIYLTNIQLFKKQTKQL